MLLKNSSQITEEVENCARMTSLYMVSCKGGVIIYRGVAWGILGCLDPLLSY